MSKILLGALILVVSLSSCRSFRMLKGESEVFPRDSSMVYHIRIADKLSLSIKNHTELSVGSIFDIYNSNEVYGKWVLVQQDGTATFPSIERLNVKGLTLQQLADTIAVLHSAIIQPTDVVVKVVDLQATVLGEVKNPGSYVFDKDRIDLLELLGKAGGLNYYSNLKSVEIFRQDDKQVHKYEVDLGKFETIEKDKVWIYPHDVVYVRAMKFQHVEKRLGIAIPVASILTAVLLLLKFQ